MLPQMVLDRVTEGLSGPSKISGLVLVVTNMNPIFGVILFDWSVFQVVALYWAENVIIGIMNVPKMILASGDDETESSTPSFFVIPFFLVHYGIFCLVHGVFVFALLGDGGFNPFGGFGSLLGNVASSTGLAFAFLLLSHLFSLFWNYIGQREYRETTIMVQMIQPYGRIVVLHIAILFGALAVQMLGAPVVLLIILITGKTALDLGFHFFSHSKPHAKETSPGFPT